GVFWTHSDSGNPPLLFAITRTGELLATYRVQGAVNLDWEAIETDDDGRLYLCDVGNNLPGLPLKTRWIDIVREPNPRSLPKNPTRTDNNPADAVELPLIEIERQLHFTFPDQPQDVEGVVCWKDTLLLFSKVHQGTAPVFALPLTSEKAVKPPRSVPLKPLGDGVSSLRITGAALTPKRDRLALCSYDYVRVFELSGENFTDDKALGHLDRCPNRVMRFAATQTEGCEWDGDNLILVSEDRQIFEIPCPRK
ncbi:MAG TPA: hypothetical protein VK137_21255, partial [Planctomycetaceae bacterium]|nr:hypothetical protein [Planctomycetaceae bacterium]